MGYLKNKKGIVMGVANDHSIAWGIAQKLSDEGAELCFTYQGDSLLRRVKPLAESINNVTNCVDVRFGNCCFKIAIAPVT